MRRLIGLCVTVLSIAVLPSAALAQAVITGSVKDTSGAVLPGVSVEATSPVLIEKVRSSVTDGAGQYRIEDLRPGTYTVTFMLPGFTTFRREGIELTGSFIATINADLKVGTLEETVVVTGASPIVDVQSARRQTTLNSDVIRSIPTVRNYNSMVVLVPGVITNANDVATGPLINQFPIHGGRANESRLTIDGLNVGNPPGGNQPPTYVADVGNAQEVTFTTSGGLGESETAGLVMNIVPKTGGNRYEGAFYFSGTGEHLQSSNYTDELRDAGLAQATPISKVYDLNGGVRRPDQAGPGVVLHQRPHAGQHANHGESVLQRERRRPDQWLVRAGPEPARLLRSHVGEHQRPRHLAGDAAQQGRRILGRAVGLPEVRGNDAPASRRRRRSCRPRPTASARRNRFAYRRSRGRRRSRTGLLFDAGFGVSYYGWGNFEREGNPTRDLVRVQEQCAGGCANNGGIPSLVYRSQDWNDNYTGAYTWRASASYVTGAHSMKLGYQGTYFYDERTSFTNDQQLMYRVNNGVPNQLTMAVPFTQSARAAIAAFYAQEQWTLGRLTLQGALRFDRARGWFPPQQVGPTRFMPNPVSFPKTEGVDSYKDITPRLGVAYDVFGNGRTAAKFTLGKYLEGASTGNPVAFYNTNPTLRMPNTNPPFGPQGVQRTWTDANGNFQPDCDLQNPLSQDLRGTGGDFCGQISNLAFGTDTLTNSFAIRRAERLGRAFQ